jgi:hypothetical protein
LIVSSKRLKVLRDLAFMLLLFQTTTLLLSAGTIASVTGAEAVGPNVGCCAASGQTVAIGWSATTSYSNVDISGDLGSGFTPAHFTAYLTDLIGPSATPANVLSTANFVVDDPCLSICVGVVTPIFTGLTLAPGTYWVVLADLQPAEQGPNGGQWFSTGNPALTTDAGVTYLGTRHASGIDFAAFAPGSNFSSSSGDVLFSVTGTAVPEPATLSMGIAALAVSLLARAKVHTNRQSRSANLKSAPPSTT